MTAPDQPTPPTAHILRLSDLASRKPTHFIVKPAGAHHDALLADLRTDLGVESLRKVRLEGKITPKGKNDWHLTAQLGATVTQPCVATLEPVTTRIDEPLERIYTANPPAVDEATEIEMPEDDRIEPLQEAVDLMHVLLEALTLSVPEFPRIEGSAPVKIAVTEPEKEAMTDKQAKPFAGLADLLKGTKD
jgi:uncharacterized metal-binding protein YceD (DUF177 family)